MPSASNDDLPAMPCSREAASPGQIAGDRILPRSRGARGHDRGCITAVVEVAQLHFFLACFLPPSAGVLAAAVRALLPTRAVVAVTAQVVPRHRPALAAHPPFDGACHVRAGLLRPLRRQIFHPSWSRPLAPFLHQCKEKSCNPAGPTCRRPASGAILPSRAGRAPRAA